MLRVLVLLTCVSSCAKVAVDMAGLACGEDGCVDGWVCHPENGVCVQEIAVGCDDDTSYCPITVQTGGPCTPVGAFLPCAEGVEDCSAGCRTCTADGWSDCTPGECTLGELTSCSSCDDDCTARVQNATATCNTAAIDPVCDYSGECHSGYRDGDGNRANGCETVCVQSNGGVETCDGQDNDCNGEIDDDIVDLKTDCDGQLTSGGFVATWSCPAGSCVVVTCEANNWDINTSGTDGCEYACTHSGAETCDGQDNDCNDVDDDVVNPTTDCFDILPDDEPEVSAFACVDGSCEITGCNAGYVDLDGIADTGCEETCTETNGGVERCDGDDNDCDGTPNNPTEVDAEFCTEYFLDTDFDAFGATDDTQCWCAPIGNYTALVGGDCDDTVGTCTSDCTTDVDADTVRDCEDTCIDGDNDGYGDPGGAGNSCTNTDCDDAVGTCNTDCATNVDKDSLRDCEDTCVDADGDGYGSPGGAGNTCTGTDCAEGVDTCNFDCTTDVDNDATRDCEDTCLDEDGDGYGVAGGGGNTCAGGDCDDDPSGCGTACHDGGVEICDNQDNDCLSGIDNGLDGVCACVGGVVPPLPPEDCGTVGVDDNCNDAIDEGCVTFIQPSNLPDDVDVCQGTEPLVVGAGDTVTIGTNWPPRIDAALTDKPVVGNVPQGGGAPNITVFYFTSIAVQATGTLVVEGGPALALVACDTVTVTGLLDACAAGQGGGPGGWSGGARGTIGEGPRPGLGGEGNTNDPWQMPGGGGAGYCRAGGDGGSAIGDGDSGDIRLGGEGGGVYDQVGADTLIPLIGGSGGGGGGEDAYMVGDQVGGGGGGAIQIVANDAILVDGGINVCGAGGGVDGGAIEWAGGAGGGAGGAILLEAPIVTISGTLAANGGGGGGGECSFSSNNPWAEPGADGQLSSSRADGGTAGSGSWTGGDGGDGGADEAAAANGENGTGADCGGGGGGGVGFVRINADTVVDSGTISPAASDCYTQGAPVYQ